MFSTWSSLTLQPGFSLSIMVVREALTNLRKGFFPDDLLDELLYDLGKL
jgi:hypothetical protein